MSCTWYQAESLRWAFTFILGSEQYDWCLVSSCRRTTRILGYSFTLHPCCNFNMHYWHVHSNWVQLDPKASTLFSLLYILLLVKSLSYNLRHSGLVIMALSPSVSLGSASIFVSTSTLATATGIPADIILSSRTSYRSSTLTSLIACLTPMFGLMYLAVLSWAWRYSMSNPRPMNKTSGILIQQYAPSIYIFLVLVSLVEVAIASWLTWQYRFNHNYPNMGVRTGARLLLFTSCWTLLTAGAYSIVFLHSVWSKHPIASIGAQIIWIFVTLIFWIVGAGILHTAASSFLLHRGRCGPDGVVYCGQIRALFGIAVVESFMLAAGMLAMLCGEGSR